jgi:FixJ family two-component response regulator
MHPARSVYPGSQRRERTRKWNKVPIISIVDDDDEIRAAVKSLLQSYGLKAQGFVSAEEFLESSLAEQTACLITDVQMPGMSGVDLQDALIKRDPRLPIIFISAFPEERLQRKVEAAGALAFLSKPFDAEELMACVHRAINKTY